MPRSKKAVVPMQARTSFAIGQKVVRQGDLLMSDDPLVKGREHLFINVTEVVEMATAVPGQARTRPPRAKEQEDGDDAE